jgi:hypothetical protein
MASPDWVLVTNAPAEMRTTVITATARAKRCSQTEGADVRCESVNPVISQRPFGSLTAKAIGH